MTQPVSYIVFDLQLIDLYTQAALSAPGGTYFVCQTGTALLQTIYDPDNNYALVTSPRALSGGRLRFAIQQAAGGQAFPPTVDLYGITAAGRYFVRQGQTPGSVPNIFIDSNARDFTAVIPYSFAAAGAAVEYNTGIALPAGQVLVKPEAAILVQAVDTAAKTITVGTLSSQGGGQANGFINAVSMAALGVKKATILGASQTLGTLLTVVSQATSTLVPEWYAPPTTAPLISYTLLAATVSGYGFIILPYTIVNQ